MHTDENCYENDHECCTLAEDIVTTCGLEDHVFDLPLEMYDPVKDDILHKHLSDFEGKWTVLVFYPADFTFVCPTELKDLNQKYENVISHNTELLVASTDTVFSHKRRVETEPLLKGFRIPMIADRTQSLGRSFDAINEETGNAERATIIISPKGIIKSIEMTTEPLGRNAAELERKMKALNYMDKHPGVACQASRAEETETQLKPGIGIAGNVGKNVK